MIQTQLSKLALKVAGKYTNVKSIRRSDVIRDVVRTHKLNLEDSIVLADCIVKGMYQAGKTIVL